MKRLLLVLVIALGICASSPVTYAKGHRGGGGVKGTVTEIDNDYFYMTIKEKTVKVFVSHNTKFLSHGKEASSSVVKVGVNVAVAGSTDGLTIQAVQVDVD